MARFSGVMAMLLVGLVVWEAAGTRAGNAAATTATATASQSDHEQVCNSLSGPFCLHIGVDAAFRPYMTPIGIPQDPSNAEMNERNDQKLLREKKCFFQHFARSWMDAGGDANDVMSQNVKTVDECERLCCDHPKCRSFTFWMGTTCFLRATKNIARADGNSFSANKLT